MTTKEALSDGRNYGIDLLRLLSMFMVVALHVLGNTGVFVMAMDAKGIQAWLLETCFYCTVDCFAMISGYVGYSEKEKRYRYGRYLNMWVQVLTYSFGITLACFFLLPGGVSRGELIRALFPVTTRVYWYFCAYTGLFFVIPWINRLMRAMTGVECTRLAALLILLFSVYATLARGVSDPFVLDEGYSFVWLSVMYVVGAWLKKCDVPRRCDSRYLVCGMLGGVLLAWGWRVVVPVVPGLFISYLSPVMVLIAASLVCIFANAKVGAGLKKVAACLAPAAFGVYLLHSHPVLWDRAMKGVFDRLAQTGAAQYALVVLGFALAVFAVCLMIEKLRIWLFRKLGIDAALQGIATAIGNIARKRPLLSKLVD